MDHAKRLIYLLTCGILLYASCDKTGPVGPQGAKGATGPQGIQGATGAPGSQGPAGTANVIYSTWFSPNLNASGSGWTIIHNTSDFSTFTGSGESQVSLASGSPANGAGAGIVTDTAQIHFDFNHPAPGITQTILDQGVVLTYAKLNNYHTGILPVNQVFLLPLTVFYDAFGVFQIDVWSAFPMVDSLKIDFVNSTNLYNAQSSFFKSKTPLDSFRYVIIPGGIVGDRLASPPPDYKNYAAVCKYFGIPQ